MTTAAPEKSNIIVLAEFFCAGESASKKMAAIKGLTDHDKVRAAVASATSSSQSTAATTKATAKPKRLTKAQKAEQEALASIKAAGTEAFTAAKNTSGLKAGFEAQAKFYRDLNALVAA